MQPKQASVAPNDATDLIEGEEHVLGVIHKNWIGLFGIYAMAVAALVALVALAFFVLPDLQLSSDALRLAIAAAIAVTVFLVALIYVIIYVYEQSKLTLTDKSLVQMIQRGLFNKKISRLSMSNVEDVNVEQRGILSHIFNYGTLTVQTAGQEDNFIFSQCPNANAYAEHILEARQAYARHHPGEDNA